MKSRLLSIALLLLTVPAFSAPRDPEAAFHKADRNGDGIVTAKELPNAKHRARFDQNGDGEVTLSEYRSSLGIKLDGTPDKNAAVVARIDNYIKNTDANGDGRLTREEVGKEDWFDRVDRNDDGVIGPIEIGLVRGLVKKHGERALAMKDNEISEAEFQKITSGPEILKPGDVGIGRMVPDATFTDLDGNTYRMTDAKNYRGVVFAMTSATCPVSKRLLPSLAKLQATLTQNKMALVLVNAFASETEEEIRAPLADANIKTAYIHDTDKTLSRVLGATTTTEVFLIDAKRTLLYRGALDDQYGIDYSLDAPRHRYLEAAIEALLNNTTPAIAATAAPGCEINYKNSPEATSTPSTVTYHRDVARILQRNCVRCHNDNGIAPFALQDFDEVSDRARVIRRVVSEGTMPPWFAAPPEASEENPWANDHSLSARDKADLLAWLNSDQPEGDPADAPAPLTFPSAWSMGTPDHVIPLSKAYQIKATGFMPYQRDVVTTKLSEDKWVTGYEILPSARDVVHHVIVQVQKPGRKEREINESQGFWAAYVPGNGAVQYPEGFARKLPAGAKVQFQIHYTPSGKAKTERLKLGLHFADEPPQYEVRTLAIADRELNIPPGERAHREGTGRTMPSDLPAIAFMAHMHTRGAAFSYELMHPDGRQETLLDIPRYDFNWQLRYALKKPRILPAGSTVKVTGIFDNSVHNQANPDPSKLVKWGDQTVEEMLIGYIEYFTPIQQAQLSTHRK